MGKWCIMVFNFVTFYYQGKVLREEPPFFKRFSHPHFESLEIFVFLLPFFVCKYVSRSEGWPSEVGFGIQKRKLFHDVMLSQLL